MVEPHLTNERLQQLVHPIMQAVPVNPVSPYSEMRGEAVNGATWQEAAAMAEELLALRAALPMRRMVQPWDTRPAGEEAMEPDELNVFEGSWAVVMGTNAKPAGWVDTYSLFAGQTYRDNLSHTDAASLPARPDIPDVLPIEDGPMRFFSGTVDNWSAAEWFGRLAGAVRAQDAAVVSGDDGSFETYRMIAASSAMRLVRDFEQQVRLALDTGAGGQEPVAYMWRWLYAEGRTGPWNTCLAAREARPLTDEHAGMQVIPLYASPEPKAGVVVTDEMVADIATALWRPDIPAEVRVVAHAALRKALTAALNGADHADR
ncbi:hypothetical protein GCM10007913_12060 [Devosia yakushimensis]|uniref:Uncharacterized protein n=1 Tax=Devosia yakushimensis TaxID=470028 RepID=A0ABQ5UAZ6_9HYPH|nr:hypothetical protein [Devosia yakushimensis]GLQ09274.1 hypothetical protein GCM10007913_12060 [Devosia yakushimensis]